MPKTSRDWEKLAQRDPYYAVITDARYRQATMDDAARQAFFQSGEDHVERVFALIQSELDIDFRPDRALDFGCGVGRTLMPLARRSAQVIGYDVAPTMLAEAGKICANHANIMLVDGDFAAVPGQFDLMQANCYNLNRLFTIIQGSGCGELLLRFTDHQGLGYLGVVIICRKRLDTSL